MDVVFNTEVIYLPSIGSGGRYASDTTLQAPRWHVRVWVPDVKPAGAGYLPHTNGSSSPWDRIVFPGCLEPSRQ